MTRDEEQLKLLFLNVRGAIDEYVAAVEDTTKPLHNREECSIKKPCALCRRRWKAEDKLLELAGRRGRGQTRREMLRLVLDMPIRDSSKSRKM